MLNIINEKSEKRLYQKGKNFKIREFSDHEHLINLRNYLKNSTLTKGSIEHSLKLRLDRMSECKPYNHKEGHSRCKDKFCPTCANNHLSKKVIPNVQAAFKPCQKVYNFQVSLPPIPPTADGIKAAVEAIKARKKVLTEELRYIYNKSQKFDSKVEKLVMAMTVEFSQFGRQLRPHVHGLTNSQYFVSEFAACFNDRMYHCQEIEPKKLDYTRIFFYSSAYGLQKLPSKTEKELEELLKIIIALYSERRLIKSGF